jgi:hypothetical protein
MLSSVGVEKSCCISSVHEPREKLRLFADDLCSEGSELVVAATGVVRSGRIASARLDHERVSD